jgi:hypothetical protein
MEGATQPFIRRPNTRTPLAWDLTPPPTCTTAFRPCTHNCQIESAVTSRGFWWAAAAAGQGLNTDLSDKLTVTVVTDRELPNGPADVRHWSSLHGACHGLSDPRCVCPAATYSVAYSPAGTMEVIGGGLLEPLVSCASCVYSSNRLSTVAGSRLSLHRIQCIVEAASTLPRFASKGSNTSCYQNTFLTVSC